MQKRCATTHELIRGFLRQATKAAGDRLGAEAATAVEPFCEARPDIDWGKPVARKAHESRRGDRRPGGHASHGEGATTYNTQGRGTEQLSHGFARIDLLPYGRQEEWQESPEGWPQSATYSRWASSEAFAQYPEHA